MASSTNTPGPEGAATPDPSQGPGAAVAESSVTAGDDDISEPPLKRARSSSGLEDGAEGTPGPGMNERHVHGWLYASCQAPAIESCN